MSTRLPQRSRRWWPLLVSLLSVALAPSTLLAGPPAAGGPGRPFLIRLGATTAAGQRGPVLADGRRVLREQLHLGPTEDLRPLRTETDELGYVHERFQQYHQGVKVEHGICVAHVRNGQVELLSGEIRQTQGLSVQPALAAAAARQHALRAVGATRYMWQDAAEERALRQRTGDRHATYLPGGELVIVDDYRQPAGQRKPVLAWKFNVYAQQPRSRAWVYVDAQTGQVVLRDNIIKHAAATGTLATKYSGTQTSTTDSFGTTYRLRDPTRGAGVNTFNCQQTTSYSGAVDFTDEDNNWTAAEFDNAEQDNAGLDAHFGAQATYDYWQTAHNRNSFDGAGAAINSYVHFDFRFENAFWDGAVMTYGDGAARFRPLTCLDVCGHEIGHAVCEHTANLVYEGESGAMNEGFSDIWGACVEHFKDSTKQTWLVGEEIDMQQTSLRSMSNPNAQQCPDTYEGTFWDPFQEVHTNSGVLNYWFYLLSVGGSGINDNNDAYSVTGINIHKAARIAYRAERLYLSPSSDYLDCSILTLQAAADLYGSGSPEFIAVAQAWYAVGIGEPTPTIIALTPDRGLIGETVVVTGTNFTSTYRVAFSNGVVCPTFTVNSPTQLTVLVPVGAVTGPVTVTTPAGVATSPMPFVITSVGPVPTITSFTPPNGQLVGGAVTIEGTNLTGATLVRFNGGAATSFNVNPAGTRITTTVPPTASTGPLKVTTPGGIATAPTIFNVLPAITSFTPASGYVGVPVTLTGTGFLGTTAVQFNGTAASFRNVTATSLTAFVPSGATTGPLRVTTPSGFALSATNFTVVSSPLPTIISFTPASGGPNTTVTVTGTGFWGTTRVAFNGARAASFTVVSATQLTAIVPLNATTGRITVTTPGGTATSATNFVITAAVCQLAVALSPSGTVCAAPGASAVLSASATGAALVSSYSAAAIPFAPLPATGQVGVTGDDNTSNPLPIGFSFNYFGQTYSSFVLSTNGNIQFNSSMSTIVYGGSVPDNIAFPDNFIALAWADWNQNAGGSITYYTTGVTPNRKLVVSYVNVPHYSINGAMLTGQIVLYEGSNEIDLIYTTTGTTDVFMLAGVENDGGTLGAAIPGRNSERWHTATDAWRFTPGSVPGAVHYSWSPGTGLSSIAGPTVTATPTTTTTYTVTVVDAMLCSQTATVTVAPAPAAPATLGSARCGTGPVTLTASGAPAGGAYRWYTQALGGTPIQGAAGASYTTPSLTATTTYYAATVVGNGGCESILRTAATATINAAPTLPVAVATPATVIQGQATTLSVATPQAGVTYTWTGPGLSGSVAGPSLPVTPPSVGTHTYSVTATGAVGCGTSSAATVIVTVTPNAAAPQLTGFTPAAGLVGSTVTLTGVNLTGATVVLFNGVPATIVGTTGTTVTVTVPAGALPGPIALTTPNGNTASATSFCVQFAAVTANAARCGPGPLTLTTSGAPASSGFYRWYTQAVGGTPLNGQTTASYTTPSLSTTQTYYVAIVAGTGANACEGPRTPAVATINAAPAATIAAGGALTFCQGGSVTLTAAGAGTNGTYLWSNGQTTASITVTAGGAYTVTTTNAGGCAATSAATTVTVTPLPTPSIVASSATTFCQGGQVQLTATGGGAGAIYQWQRNGQPISGATAATYTASQAGQYAARITQGTCAATSAPATVTVNPLTTAAFAYAATTYCQTSTANLMPTVTGTSGGAFTATPAGLQLNPATGALAPAASLPGTYTVTYAVAGPCPASATQTLTVTAAPSAAFSYAAAGGCAGVPGTLLPALGSGATAGQFTASPAGLTLNPVTGAINLAASAAGTYTVTNLIGATGSCGPTSALTTVSLNPQPTATVAASGPLTFCQGDSVVLTASGGATYSWNTGAPTATLTVRTAGTYVVTASSPAGCQVAALPVTVVVNSRPAPPTITQSPQPSGIVLLTSSAATGNQWLRNGQSISGATGATYAVTTSTQSGQYSVVVTGANGCTSAPASPASVTVTGVTAAPGADAALWLLPNPVSAGEVAQLEIGGDPQPRAIVVLNALGQQVLTLTLPASTSTGPARYELPVRHLARGVYLVRCAGLTRRLVVE